MEMTSAPPITVLDVAYDVLALSRQPLSADEIAEVAREHGYDLDGYLVRYEIDAHLQEHGYLSPFIEIGQLYYGLQEIAARRAGVALDLSILRPLLVGLSVLFVAILTFVVPVLDTPQAASEVAQNPAPPPAEEPAPPVVQPAGPGWWGANAVNQINQETQEVARQYLRNYYNTCGPAVVAVLASFYRAQSQEGGGAGGGERISTAQVLQDAKHQLGYYNPPYNSGLLTFDRLREMLSLYGVEQSYPSGGGEFMSLDELLEGLRQGHPAIVGMRYGYQGDGARYLPAGGRGIYNHFVIVFGTTQEDGQEKLWLYNPHPAKYSYDDGDAAPVTISLDEFMGSWALNDGSEWAHLGHAVFYQPRP